MMHLLDCGDCFEAPQSAGESRDQTAGVSLLAYPHRPA